MNNEKCLFAPSRDTEIGKKLIELNWFDSVMRYMMGYGHNGAIIVFGEASCSKLENELADLKMSYLKIRTSTDFVGYYINNNRLNNPHFDKLLTYWSCQYNTQGWLLTVAKEYQQRKHIGWSFQVHIERQHISKDGEQGETYDLTTLADVEKYIFEQTNGKISEVSYIKTEDRNFTVAGHIMADRDFKVLYPDLV